jgi:hypothetical protein
MPDTDTQTGLLEFAASFPLEEQFAPTAGDLAARLAQTSGCGDAAATELRQAIDAAFHQAVAGNGAGRARSVLLALHTTVSSFEADLSCGGDRLLHLSRPRSAGS